MSLFAKKKAPRRQFRKKVIHSLEDEEDGLTLPQQEQTNGVHEPTDSGKQLSTDQPPSTVPRSLLSFDDDMGEDVTEFKLKKKNNSKRLAKKLDQQRKKEELQKQIEQSLNIDDDFSDSEQESTFTSLTHRMSAGYIPDSTMIHAARKKREMARKMGGGGQAPDVISLETSSRSKQESVKGKSRLVREDDYDKSDESEEEEGRGTFGKRTEVTHQMRVLTAMEEADSGSDEERFVQEQINKAVKGSVVSETTSKPLQHSHIAPSFASIQTEQPQQTARYDIPETLVPITMETLKSRLSQQLGDLRTLHSSHSRRVEEMESDLLTADREIDGLEGHIDKMSLEYQFYQESRGYLRDLLSCLSEKVPVVDNLERTLHSVLGELTELRIERRRQDMRDMAAECVQTTPPDHTHQLRIVEREGRRRRRREGRRERGVAGHYEGQSSDDELLETNRIKFKNDIDALISKGDKVFSDVTEEFSDLNSIKTHLEQWKFSFPSSYDQAYISLCMPKLISPFIRLELLNWNPLHDGCGCLEDCRWFQVLMFYGFLEGEAPDMSDEDTLLLPKVIEKVVLPKLTALVQSAWDPLSSAQTTRLVSLIQTLLDDYPTLSTEERSGQSLINTVTLKLRQAMDGDVYIPLFGAKQIESPGSVKSIFYHRQFWSCLKLLGNITKWVDLINVDTLQELVLDGLLNRYLLLSLQNSPVAHLSVDKVKQLVCLLPTSWFSDGCVVTRPLQGLVRYIVHLLESLVRAAQGQNDIEKTNTRCSVRSLAGCLVTIGAHTEALTVAKEHNLKDLLSSIKS